jgi:hypothetical protein
VNRKHLTSRLIKAIAAATYYGGTIAAGLGFYQLLDSDSALSIATLIAVTMTVGNLLDTLTTGLTNTGTGPQIPTADAATAKDTEGVSR